MTIPLAAMYLASSWRVATWHDGGVGAGDFLTVTNVAEQGVCCKFLLCNLFRPGDFFGLCVREEQWTEQNQWPSPSRWAPWPVLTPETSR